TRFKQLAAQLAPIQPSMIQNPTLPVRGFQYMKEELDKIVRQQGIVSNTVEGKPIASRRSGSAIQAAISQMRDEVSQQVPDYGTALDIWAGHTSLLESQALGQGGVVQRQADIGGARPAQF